MNIVRISILLKTRMSLVSTALEAPSFLQYYDSETKNLSEEQAEEEFSNAPGGSAEEETALARLLIVSNDPRKIKELFELTNEGSNAWTLAIQKLAKMPDEE